MPEEIQLAAAGAAPDPLALARAAIDSLGHPAGLLIRTAYGLDGHKPSMADQAARELGYGIPQARVIVLQASAQLARGHRPAFDALVRHYGPDRPAAVAADPWYRLAVTLTRGSLSRWAR